MSASTLTVFDIVNGPSAAGLWNAAQHRRAQYFIARPTGTNANDRSLNRRITGMPSSIDTDDPNANVLHVRMGRISEPQCFDITYDTARKTGTMSCDVSKAQLEWLGLCFDIHEPLANRGIHTVADALACNEFHVCNALLEDLVGYPMSNDAAQRAVGRFVRLRQRLQALNPALEFHGGTHDELDLFMGAF